MCNQQSLRSACAYAQSDQSLCWSLGYSMTVKLLTEQHLEFLSLKRGCSGLSESTLVKMPHCWKSHVMAQSFLFQTLKEDDLRVLLTALRIQFKYIPSDFFDEDWYAGLATGTPQWIINTLR